MPVHQNPIAPRRRVIFLQFRLKRKLRQVGHNEIESPVCTGVPHVAQMNLPAIGQSSAVKQPDGAPDGCSQDIHANKTLNTGL